MITAACGLPFFQKENARMGRFKRVVSVSSQRERTCCIVLIF